MAKWTLTRRLLFNRSAWFRRTFRFHSLRSTVNHSENVFQLIDFNGMHSAGDIHQRTVEVCRKDVRVDRCGHQNDFQVGILRHCLLDGNEQEIGVFVSFMDLLRMDKSMLQRRWFGVDFGQILRPL